jgi:hypothetical protein
MCPPTVASHVTKLRYISPYGAARTDTMNTAEGSTPLIPRPTIGHIPWTVPSAFTSHTLAFKINHSCTVRSSIFHMGDGFPNKIELLSSILSWNSRVHYPHITG